MANGSVPTASGVTNPKYSVSASPQRRPYNVISGSSGGVEYIREELSQMFAAFDIVEDACGGALYVKAAGTTYLPDPDPRRADPYRYAAYIMRAVFYNVTRRTLEGLIGQIFARPAHSKVPKSIEIVLKDCDGSGLSIEQAAKKAEEFVLKFGRCGLLADFPATAGPTTRQQIINGTIRPTLTVYDPANVRNWRTIVVNGRQLLSLVVLAELYDREDDGFESKKDVQYRVLRLEKRGERYVYTVEVHRPAETPDKKRKLYTAENKYEVKDARGNNLEEIAFTFIGAKTNNSEMDYPPLFDIADLNIAHYRNSAELEENLFMVGQGTPWCSGVSEAWAKDVLGGTLELGSRGLISLPEGASVGLLEASENSGIAAEMDRKEKRMVALGAKLVENKQVQRTAKEAGQEESAELSVLAATANNVSAAFKWCLEWCAIFTGDVTQDKDARSKAVEFKLNTEFELSELSPAELDGVVKTWQSDLITDEEARAVVTKAGFATQPFDVWKQERDDKMTAAMDLIEAENNQPNNVGNDD